MITRRRRDEDQPTGREQQPEHASAWPTRARLSGDAQRCGVYRAVGSSCLTLIIGRFSRDYRELRLKNTIIPLPYAGSNGPTASEALPFGRSSWKCGR